MNDDINVVSFKATIAYGLLAILLLAWAGIALGSKAAVVLACVAAALSYLSQAFFTQAPEATMQDEAESALESAGTALMIGACVAWIGGLIALIFT